MILKAADLKLELTIKSHQFPHLQKLKPGKYILKMNDKEFQLRQSNEKIFINNASAEEREKIIDFLALNEEYSTFHQKITQNTSLIHLKSYFGVKILNLPLFDTVILKILSSNNDNERVLFLYKKLLEITVKNKRSFPPAEVLASSSASYLAKNGFGRHAESMITVAAIFAENTDIWEELRQLPSEEARAVIKEWPGCGEMISDEILLYGLRRREVFPSNIYIKDRLLRLLPANTELSSFLQNNFSENCGYLYHYLKEDIRHESIRKRKRKKT